MDKQISLRKRILECKDRISLLKLTCSPYFKNCTDGYYHYYYQSFSECVKSVRSFLYSNDIVSSHVRINPYIDPSTLSLRIDLNFIEDFSDGFNFKAIGIINIDTTYSFQIILNRVLDMLKNRGFITELPF